MWSNQEFIVMTKHLKCIDHQQAVNGKTNGRLEWLLYKCCTHSSDLQLCYTHTCCQNTIKTQWICVSTSTNRQRTQKSVRNMRRPSSDFRYVTAPYKLLYYYIFITIWTNSIQCHNVILKKRDNVWMIQYNCSCNNELHLSPFKIWLHKSIILAVPLYSVEMWSVSKVNSNCLKTIHRLYVLENNTEHSMEGQSEKSTTGQERLETTVTKKQLHCFVHTQCTEDSGRAK